MNNGQKPHTTFRTDIEQVGRHLVTAGPALDGLRKQLYAFVDLEKLTAVIVVLHGGQQVYKGKSLNDALAIFNKL